MLACIATTACLLARRPHRVPDAADRPAGTQREKDRRELRVTAAARPALKPRGRRRAIGPAPRGAGFEPPIPYNLQALLY